MWRPPPRVEYLRVEDVEAVCDGDGADRGLGFHVAASRAGSAGRRRFEEAGRGGFGGRPMGRCAMGVAWAAALLALAALAFAAAPRPSGDGRVRRRGAAPAGIEALGQEAHQEMWECGELEDDVDYWTGEALTFALNVSSPADCRKWCQEEAKCFAWTWGRQHGIAGAFRAYHTCFLKERGDKPQRYGVEGVVSGLACPRDGLQLPAHPSIGGQAVVTTPTATPGSGGTGSGGRHYLRSPPQRGTLFCFALALPFGYEPVLLAMQYAERQSIFDCDNAAVYSNESLEVAPGLRTNVVDMNLQASYGGEFNTALNTGIFIKVWSKVIEDGVFDWYTWTAKVDPDCVFFPSRLRTLVAMHTDEGDKGVYLNNCKFGLHGPLEVLSRRAVKVWGAGHHRCSEHFRDLCSGDCLWGEDMFLDQCFQRVLGPRREYDSGLLMEDHCAPPADWSSCADPFKVAFHPFKTHTGYQRCLQNSAQAAGEPLTEGLTVAALQAAEAAGGSSGFIRAQAAPTSGTALSPLLSPPFSGLKGREAVRDEAWTAGIVEQASVGLPSEAPEGVLRTG